MAITPIPVSPASPESKLQPAGSDDAIVCTYAAWFIAYWEGYEEAAYWDVNHWRVGYGSDTEGPQQVNVVQSTNTTKDRALANLHARIPQYLVTVKSQLGPLYTKLGLATIVACVDLAYNYGSIPPSILKAFITNGATVASAIRAHDPDNNGVNRDRRAGEAGLIILDGGQVQ